MLNATLPDQHVVDVGLRGGLVEEVVPAQGRTAGEDELDLSGYLLLPAPADPHAHLDKALSWDVISPPMGDLGLAIDSWRVHSRTMSTESIAERATAAAELMLRNGTTAVRTHVDILTGPHPMRGVEALIELRERLSGIMDLQITALAGPDAPDETIHQALDLGVDLVGGAPHLAAEPLRDLDRLLAIAEKRCVGADIHTDEGLYGEPTLEHFAKAVQAWPSDRIRSAGHCVRQGTLPAEDLTATIEAVKQAGMGIISLPITNLYLQGWDQPVSTPRGLTALRAFLDAGVTVAAGADNLRDPFNPVGRGDALETASLLVTAGHLSVQEAYHAVSDGARDVLGLPRAGVFAGAAADLLAIRAGSLGEAVAAASPDRIVLYRGAVVARTSVVSTTALEDRR
nr:amidohydrolase family protein [Kineosporia babensis]